MPHSSERRVEEESWEVLNVTSPLLMDSAAARAHASPNGRVLRSLEKGAIVRRRYFYEPASRLSCSVLDVETAEVRAERADGGRNALLASPRGSNGDLTASSSPTRRLQPILINPRGPVPRSSSSILTHRSRDSSEPRRPSYRPLAASSSALAPRTPAPLPLRSASPPSSHRSSGALGPSYRSLTSSSTPSTVRAVGPGRSEGSLLRPAPEPNRATFSQPLPLLSLGRVGELSDLDGMIPSDPLDRKGVRWASPLQHFASNKAALPTPRKQALT